MTQYSNWDGDVHAIHYILVLFFFLGNFKTYMHDTAAKGAVSDTH
jgi:hypothetical protein